jgi:Peptidase inhibitor family I36
MRRFHVLIVTLAALLAALVQAVPTQAASGAPVTYRTVVVHGTSLVVARGSRTVVAHGSVPRDVLASQVAAPAATNPCLGRQLVCLFRDANGGGFIDEFTASFLITAGIWNLTDDPCPPCRNGNFNDEMSSWGNDTGGIFCWWVDINGGGAGHTMRSLGATIQNVLPSENDQASSVGLNFSTCH